MRFALVQAVFLSAVVVVFCQAREVVGTDRLERRSADRNMRRLNNRKLMGKTKQMSSKKMKKDQDDDNKHKVPDTYYHDPWHTPKPSPPHAWHPATGVLPPPEETTETDGPPNVFPPRYPDDDVVVPPPHKSPNHKKSHSSEKKMKSHKMEKITKSMKGGKGKGKGGKGKGKGGIWPTRPPQPSTPTISPAPTLPPVVVSNCSSPLAEAIMAAIPDAITRNPQRCCNFDGPTAVYVTHAEKDVGTPSGFEPFWNDMYEQIKQTSDFAGVCFVMTGYNPANTMRGISDVLIDVVDFVSSVPTVPALMTTDPTDDVLLAQTVRTIVTTEGAPSIGVFNSGYGNIIIEAIVTGQMRLPFIGYLDDSEYGKQGGRATLELLAGTPAKPLCFNARLGVFDFVGERCAAYYAEVTDDPITPEYGVGCSAETTPEELLLVIVSEDANAVFTHVDCCAAAAEAAAMAQEDMGRSVIVGCQDLDTTGGNIDFVTAQPIQLQAYHASAWTTYPVLADLAGVNGRGEEYFPSLQTLLNTGIYNTILT